MLGLAALALSDLVPWDLVVALGADLTLTTCLLGLVWRCCRSAPCAPSASPGPLTRRGAGRPPATANAPAQPASGEREQEARPRKEDEDRDRRRRANRGEDRDGKDPDYQASRTLALAPVCCGCTRQGVAELAFPEEVSEATFKTRPTKPSSSTFIGLCLMPNPHGTLSRGTERICGHTPRCLLRVEGVLMCPCCADRYRGAGMPPRRRRPPAGRRRAPAPFQATGGRGRRERTGPAGSRRQAAGGARGIAAVKAAGPGPLLGWGLHPARSDERRGML